MACQASEEGGSPPQWSVLEKSLRIVGNPMFPNRDKRRKRFIMLGGLVAATAVQTAMLAHLPYLTLRDAPLAHPTTVDHVGRG